ncbi:MAG TPA: hypothetical protein VFK33_10880 [Bacillales bacterium]|nr:hypothetical protein [Bacillales bacterium]
MEHPNGSDQKAIIRKLNDLYVMTRYKYLAQFKNGQYVTLDQRKSDKVVPLNDGLLKRHLKGGLTYGVFSGGYFSKFLTLDVDCETNTTARWVTQKLVFTLAESFNIRREDIHVSTSGNKGYHVDLFFDRPVLVADLRQFFAAVVAEVGAIPGGQVEFRPNWQQGVKLPLGVHQKTGARCWFVDRTTLDPLETFDYLADVVPMDASAVTEHDFELTAEQAADFELVARTVDPTVNVVSTSDALMRAKRTLEAGQLTESGTRHTTTVILATFFNSQGWEPAEAIEAIMTLLHNTPRDYFSQGSTPEHWRKETERLVGLAFDRDYKLGNADQEVNVYKSEILAVLKSGTFRTKQMALAMLITSKRYGRTFYFAESTGKRMIGTKSNDTARSTIKRLENGGFIETVRRGEIDKAASKTRGRVHYKPNKYKLLVAEPAEGEPSLTVNQDSNIVDVVNELFDTDEVKRYVKRREYDNRWKA